MRTPRPAAPTRSATLSGNGWLREAPRNLFPRGWGGWELRGGRSLLRKCMFMPAPPGARDYENGSVLPPAPRVAKPPVIVAHQNDPRRNARLIPAVSAEDVFEAQKRALYADARAKALGKNARVERHEKDERAWYEDPVALGTLLLVLPPVGLAAVWSSKRYSNDARWALTIMTALTMCLFAAVLVSLIAIKY